MNATQTKLDEVIKKIRKKVVKKEIILNKENDFNMSEIAKIPHHKAIKAETTNFLGKKEKRRILIENTKYKQIFVYCRNSRAYGYRYIGAEDIARMYSEIKLFVKIDCRTPAEKYLEEAYKYAQYFKKYSHPNLWPQLREKIRNFEEKGNIEGFLNDPNIKSHFDAWRRSSEFNILSVQMYKTTTLKTWGFTDQDIRLLKEAIENHKDTHVFSSKKYDATASIEGNKGFLSLEYRGLGNGHYYILIDEQHALYEEDD